MVIDGDKKSLDLKNKVRYIINLMNYPNQYFKITLLEGRVVGLIDSGASFLKAFLNNLIDHSLSREYFNLKIDVRDQTIWNCKLEL